MPRRYTLSRHDLTNCPSCMSHIAPESRELLRCPFCEEAYDFGARDVMPDTFGKGVMSALESSRSAALALALGASLSMSACGGARTTPTKPSPTSTPAPEANDMGSNDSAPDEDDARPETTPPAAEPVDQPLYGISSGDLME